MQALIAEEPPTARPPRAGVPGPSTSQKPEGAGRGRRRPPYEVKTAQGVGKEGSLPQSGSGPW